MPRPAPILVSLVALIVTLPVPAGRRDDDRVAELKKWYEGPVRYIATKDEITAFRALKDDRERALYIERFWHRRDPTPGTLTNENRQLFWRRVQEANQAFSPETIRAGWLTDRGKVYILYGAPTEISEDPNLRTEDAIPGGGEGVIRWIYEGRPGGRRDLDPIVVVAFVRDRTGEYKLSYDPQLNSVFFDRDAFTGRRTGIGFEDWLARNPVTRKSRLSVMLDLGKMQEVPPEELVLLERVETQDSYQTFELPAALHRLEDPEDETRTLVLVDIDLSNVDPEHDPALIARFTSRDATRKPRLLGEGSFRFATADGGGRIAEGRIALDPGTYDVLVLAADPLDAGTGLFRAVLVVAPRPTGLRLSDVVLARSLEPLEYRSLVSYREPFVVGPYRVLPRLGADLARGEPVEVLHEVYGGSEPYRVRYGVEGRDLDGAWIRLGQPAEFERTGRAHAWGLPTGPRWPEGEYRIRIEVVDAGGAQTAALVPFTLGDPEGE